MGPSIRPWPDRPQSPVEIDQLISRQLGSQERHVQSFRGLCHDIPVCFVGRQMGAPLERDQGPLDSQHGRSTRQEQHGDPLLHENKSHHTSATLLSSKPCPQGRRPCPGGAPRAGEPPAPPLPPQRPQPDMCTPQARPRPAHPAIRHSSGDCFHILYMIHVFCEDTVVAM